MTINDIIAIGRQIAAETAEGGNTAARVGGVIEAIGEILKNQDYMSWQPAGNFDIEEYYEKNDQVFDEETNSCYVSLQTDNVGHPVNENDESYEEGWWMKVIDGASVLSAAAAATQAAAEANQAAEAARGIVYQAVDDHLDTESLKPVANQVVTQAINNLSENLQDVEEGISTIICDTQDIDVNTFSTNRKYINSSNQWVDGYVSATESIASINIPVSAGETYLIEAIHNGAIYAFLKSNTTVGNPVDFSDSLQTRVVLSSRDKVKITIPSDTTILYCYYGRYNPRTSTITDDWRPQLTKISSFVVQETGQSTHDVMSQKAVSDIVADAEIDVNTYSGNLKFINSSNEWQSGNIDPNAAYSINMPVTAGETYLIEALNDGAIYAFLKSNTTIGTPVDFSSSLYGRVVMDKYEKRVITIPSDTTILYIFKYIKKRDTGYINSEFRPRLVKLSSIGIIENTTPHSLLLNGLMMGDSITYGVYSYFNDSQRWNGVELDNSIAEYLGKCSGTNCKNIGKRGTGYVADTRDVNNAWELAQTTDYTHVDYVVMMYGVNDYSQGVPLGTIADNVENTIVGNMTRTLNKIFTDNPNCKVICVGSYNTWGQVSQGGDYTSNVYYGDESTDYGLGYAINGHTLRDVLNIQKEVCEHYHVQFVCLADEGVVNNFNIKNTLVDGLHPTLDIRKVIAQEIAKHLI